MTVIADCSEGELLIDEKLQYEDDMKPYTDVSTMLKIDLTEGEMNTIVTNTPVDRAKKEDLEEQNNQIHNRDDEESYNPSMKVEGKKRKKFECPECDFTTAYKQHVDRHRRSVHRKEKPHKCPECNFRSVRRYQVTVHHLAVHKKWRPHRCPSCDFSAVQPYYLTRHMRSVHGQKTTVCEVCGFSTTCQDYLRKHMYRHIEESRFSCRSCGYRCHWPSALRKHVAKVHEGEVAIKREQSLDDEVFQEEHEEDSAVPVHCEPTA